MPERRCLVTGAHGDPSDMVRYALSPDGEVVPDIAGRLPGRGAWTLARRDVVAQAVARGLFARAFRARALAAADLADRVEAGLARHGLDRLGLARRSGALESGFEAVAAAVRAGRVAVLAIARDAGEDGARKLAPARRGIETVRLFDAAELGRALGRDMAVYVALTPGRLAEGFAAEAGRLAGFRAGAPEDGEDPLTSGGSDG